MLDADTKNRIDSSRDILVGKAKRSEVLFVDYIAEHLNPGGRAGVIVPEGIIFQGQNAYKNLRRLLVENYLWAVVSLPAGVFNPYSGVKTSILFLDRNLVKRTGDVLFVKIENDGFDLGAQRRPIDQNNLPAALKALEAWKQRQKTPKEGMALAVPRKRLLESGDCNFSGDRYRPTAARDNGKWPMVKLGELCLGMKSGFACGTSAVNGAGVPHLRPMNISSDGQLVWEGTKYITEDVFSENGDYALKTGDVLFNNTNSKELVGKTCFVDTDIRGGFSNHMTRLRSDPTKLLPKLLAAVLHEMMRRGAFLNLCHKWIGQAGVNNSVLATVEIPLPPLAEQERLVAELEGYRNVIEAARQIVAHYKPSIRVDPAWPRIALGDVSEFDGGLVDPKLPEYARLPHVSAENMESGNGNLLEIRSAADDKMTSGKYLFEADVFFTRNCAPICARRLWCPSAGFAAPTCTRSERKPVG